MTNLQVTQADRDNARTILDSIVANLSNQGVLTGVPDGDVALDYLALELAKGRQQAHAEMQAGCAELVEELDQEEVAEAIRSLTLDGTNALEEK